MKFELTAETRFFFGKKHFRIKAKIAFGNISAGELGGFVETENNLGGGNAWVYGDACVSGNARVYGDARVSGNACVSGDACVVWISKIGSTNGTLTGYTDKKGNIIVNRGCFSGTIKEFLAANKRTHKNSKTAKEYKLAIAFVKLRLTVKE